MSIISGINEVEDALGERTVGRAAEGEGCAAEGCAAEGCAAGIKRAGVTFLSTQIRNTIAHKKQNNNATITTLLMIGGDVSWLGMVSFGKEKNIRLRSHSFITFLSPAINCQTTAVASPNQMVII